MKSTPQAISNQISAIRENPNLNDFIQIGQEIDSLSESEDEVWRVKFVLWLRVFEVLDKATDPSFNPCDLPQMNVAPPSHMPLDAGVSSSEIKDAAVRDQYEAAIRSNADKIKKYTFQKEIRGLAEKWLVKMSECINRQFTAEARGIAEFENFIDTYISSDVRKNQLRQILIQAKAGNAPEVPQM